MTLTPAVPRVSVSSSSVCRTSARSTTYCGLSTCGPYSAVAHSRDGTVAHSRDGTVAHSRDGTVAHSRDGTVAHSRDGRQDGVGALLGLGGGRGGELPGEAGWRAAG